MPNYDRCRKQHGVLGTEPMRELKRLKTENKWLREAVSNLPLFKLILIEGRLQDPCTLSTVDMVGDQVTLFGILRAFRRLSDSGFPDWS
mgnify:CR=1 FL=1